MRRSRAIRLALGLALLCAAFAVRAETPEPATAPSPRILITGAQDRTSAARVQRSLERLVADGAKTVLLDLKDASGTPMDVLELSDRIHELTEIRTVACITGSTVGAASVIALACDEIRMTKTGLLGSIDCGRKDSDRSLVSAVLRKYQPARLLPALEGMVQRWLEVYRIEFGDGTVRIVERADLAYAMRDVETRGGLVDRKALVREDALLTLDAALAQAIGLTGPVVESADAVARELGIAIAGPRPERATAEAEATGEWTPKQCKKAAVIFLEGEIGPALWARIERRVDKIKADGSYDLLVIETDSPGGLVTHSILIGDLILETGDRMHTVAWVPRQAISGACLTSYAARDVVIGSAGTIGDCQPIIPTSGGYETLGEKIQSPLRATFRKYAQKNGYPTAIAEAMVTQEIEVVRVTDEEGRRHYFKQEEWKKLDPSEQAAYSDPEVVVEADKLPTFTAREALQNDLARRVVASRDEMLALYGVSPENVTTFPTTWSEEISAFLLAWKGWLFLIGLVALYLEFKAPGFGVAGAVGLAAFTLFFLAGAIGGVAESVEIVLFIAGVGLIAMELFVFPGFGLPGISGLVLIVVSLYMASSPFVVPNTPIAQDYLFNWMIHFGSAFVGAVIFAVVAARFLPNVPLFNRILLSPPGNAAALEASATGLADTTRALVGAKGTALTDLRPAGRAEIEGRRHDVVTQGSFIEAGSAIVVQKVKANRIVVRPEQTGETPKPSSRNN